MKLAVRLAAIAAVAAGAVVGAAPAVHGASAVSNLESGSWWQVQPDGGQVPPPPSVPPKGLWVDSSPNGDAVSAVRFRLTDAAAPVMHLRVHQDQSPTSVAVVVCATTSRWQPATAGAWSARPKPDCQAGQAAGQVNGSQMTVDLSGFTPGADGMYDVVLEPASQPVAASPVPAPAPTPGPPPQPFDITFEQPAAADISATASSPSQMPAPLTNPVDGSAAPSAVDTSPQSAPAEAPLAAPAPSAADLQPPLPAAVITPTTKAPVSTRQPVTRPRLVALKAPKGMSRRVRYLLAIILMDLALWTYFRSPLGPSGARPRLTLHDLPDRAATTAPVRTGQAPSLR